MSETLYCAYGFTEFIEDDDECFDVPLPDYEKYNEYQNALKLGKIHDKGKNGTIVYKYTYEGIKTLHENGLLQVHTQKNYKITEYIGKRFTRTYDSLSTETNYVVKAIPAPTYRDMISGLKEATINNEVYRIADRFGSLLVVCKPYFCMPYWDGSKWFFLIATECAKGKKLSQYWYLNFCFSSNKQEIKNVIEESIHTLWWLGYSHNNLNSKNVIYHKKTNTIKLVGLSQCVAMPHNQVVCFRENLENAKTSFQEQYELVYREESITLASLTQKYGRKYTNYDDIHTDDCATVAKLF